MNSVFDKFKHVSNKPSILNIVQEYRRIQQNPSEIGDVLLKVGRIDKNQYDHIKTMNSPKEIGEYLLNSNKDFQKMYNGNR